MVGHSATKLNADSHILLDQPLLRLPHELVRRNFKNVQRYVDREREHILPALKETANASMSSSSQSSEQVLASLDAMIARMQTMKRKLEILRTEEEPLLDHSSRRLQHLQDLYDIPSLVDVKYDDWSRTRLDRLVVDYLLRTGHTESATSLAEAKDISHLIDLDVFIGCHKISTSILQCEVKEALSWVNENRAALKKLITPMATQTTGTTPPVSDMEFQLRLQQYIEMNRAGTTAKKLEAMQHAAKFITPHAKTRSKAVMSASGLLAQPANTQTEPYKSLFSSARWTLLSELFISTHHSLLSLPHQPLLHTALSAGLSALKTPACHSVHNPASSSTPGHACMATSASLCPICSTELNELARAVPYAHHTKSYVDNNAVVLPNGRIYGRERLEDLQRKIVRAAGGAAAKNTVQMKDKVVVVDEDMIGREGVVTDPTTGESFLWEEVRKVYIT